MCDKGTRGKKNCSCVRTCSRGKNKLWFLSGTQKTLFCLKRQINLWNVGVISYEPIYEKRQNSVICSLSMERLTGLRSKWQVL